jgi:hypothetical protein
MKVSYEYDQDPRYGWASIDVGGDREPLIVVHSEDSGSRGFIYKNGEMIPTCICSAWDASECSCSGLIW